MATTDISRSLVRLRLPGSFFVPLQRVKGWYQSQKNRITTAGAFFEASSMTKKSLGLVGEEEKHQTFAGKRCVRRELNPGPSLGKRRS